MGMHLYGLFFAGLIMSHSGHFELVFSPLIINFVHFVAKNSKGIISLSQTIEYLRNSTYLLFCFSKQQSESRHGGTQIVNIQ